MYRLIRYIDVLSNNVDISNDVDRIHELIEYMD